MVEGRWLISSVIVLLSVADRLLRIDSSVCVSTDEKASSNIRRQLRRLKELFLVESNSNFYYITEWEAMKVLFEEKIKNFMINTIVKRVEEYFDEVDRQFPGGHKDLSASKIPVSEILSTSQITSEDGIEEDSEEESSKKDFDDIDEDTEEDKS